MMFPQFHLEVLPMPLGLARTSRFPVLVTVRLSHADAVKLRAFCETHEQTPSEAVRGLLRSLLDGRALPRQRTTRRVGGDDAA